MQRLFATVTIICGCKPFFDSWSPGSTNDCDTEFLFQTSSKCPINTVILKQITYIADTFNRNQIEEVRWANKPFCSVVVNRDSHWILLTFQLNRGRNSFTGLCKSFNQSDGHMVQIEDMRRLFYHFVYCIKATEKLKTAKKYRVKDFPEHFHDLNIVVSKNCFAHIDGGSAYQNISKKQTDSVSCGAVAMINLIAELPVRNAARLENTQCLDDVLQQRGYRAILFLDSMFILSHRVSILAYTHYTKEYINKAKKRKLMAKNARLNFKAQKLAVQGITIKKQNGKIIEMPKTVRSEIILTEPIEQVLIVPINFDPLEICAGDTFRGPTPPVPGLMEDF